MSSWHSFFAPKPAVLSDFECLLDLCFRLLDLCLCLCSLSLSLWLRLDLLDFFFLCLGIVDARGCLGRRQLPPRYRP